MTTLRGCRMAKGMTMAMPRKSSATTTVVIMTRFSFREAPIPPQSQYRQSKDDSKEQLLIGEEPAGQSWQCLDSAFHHGLKDPRKRGQFGDPRPSGYRGGDDQQGTGDAQDISVAADSGSGGHAQSCQEIRHPASAEFVR
jgi:hypothetical protein